MVALFRSLLNLGSIARLFVLLGLALRCWWTTDRFRGENRGVKVREMLISLGPTFIKFGQWASVRPDLVPHDIIAELQSLQDDAPPLPKGQPKEIVARELMKPVEEVFEVFDEIPISAASVAQVHHAVLRQTGEAVALKIQRPQVAKEFRQDIQALKLLASLFSWVLGANSVISIGGLVEVFQKTLEKEIDFLTEAHNQERARHVFEQDENIRVPQVHLEYCTRRLIVMELFVGLRLRDVDRFSELGLDREILIKALSRSFFNQFFRYGIYQADPHPGNFIFMEDNQIGIVDYGIIGMFDDAMVGILLDWFRAVIEKDVSLLLRTMLKVGAHNGKLDILDLRTDLMEYIMLFHYIKPQNISFWYVGLMFSEILNKHKIYMPSNLLYFNKSLATLEGVGRCLNPEFDWREGWRPLFYEETRRRYALSRLVQEDFKIWSEYRELWQKLPVEVDEMSRLVQHFTEETSNRLKDLIDEMRNNTRKLSFTILTANIALGAFLVIHRTGFAALGLSPETTVFASIGVITIVALLLRIHRF